MYDNKIKRSREMNNLPEVKIDYEVIECGNTKVTVELTAPKEYERKMTTPNIVQVERWAESVMNKEEI